MLLGTSRSAGATTVLVVDDDGAQCPNAGYSVIAAAIADASPGDTILVCPGSYNQTTVDKRLTLVGHTQELTNPGRCADDVNNPADRTTEDTIVAGFVLDADFVTIRSFTLRGADNGILIPWGNDDEWVSRNVFEDNSIGINLNGTMSLVDHNCFRHNNEPGSAQGTGIYSDQGLKATTIDQNVFFQHDAAAMTLLDFAGAGSLDDVRVTKNVSSHDGDMISIAGSTHSKISKNTATHADGSAIFVEAGNGPNSQLEMSNNSLTLGSDEGIFVDADALTNSTITKNTATKNDTSGLHIAAGVLSNDSNSITKNNFKGNYNTTGFDCWDETSGTGTAGTANTWSKDKGKTADPPGICKK
jgi:nitrous oxidase accessory protein NosD